MKIRIFTASKTGFYGQMLHGFDMYRRPLRARLGLSTETEVFHDLPGLLAGLTRSREDALLVMPHFRVPGDDLAATLREARERNPRPIILLDGHDQTSSPHFPVLPHVDAYIKSKMLRDPADYQQDFRGGYVFSDYFSREFDFDLRGWQFGGRPDPAFADRILPGWNFGVVRSIRWLARLNRLAPRPLIRRTFDVNMRIPTPPPREPREWYEDYRIRCKSAMQAAAAGLRTTPNERVGRLTFLRELRNSRIAFSPFGWGEVCMRDYEVVASGALLVKPDCAHLITSPDIFVPHKTYVPVRWDLSDLEERVRHYLSHLDEAQEIAANGLAALHAYFADQVFVQDVERTIVNTVRGRSSSTMSHNRPPAELDIPDRPFAPSDAHH